MPKDQLLSYDVQPSESANEDPPKEAKVSHWQDVVAALVPAEVLGIHAIVMSVGSRVEGSGTETRTVITDVIWMQAAFWGCIAVSAFLYILGRRNLKSVLTWIGGILTSIAFVTWTLLQPVSAFDSLGLPLSSTGRVVVSVIAAVAIAAATNAIAIRADKT